MKILPVLRKGKERKEHAANQRNGVRERSLEQKLTFELRRGGS